MRVVAGTNELQKAYRTQKKTRRRMCCMLVSGMCPPMSSNLLTITLSSMLLPITLCRLFSMTLWQSRSQANIYYTFLPE